MAEDFNYDVFLSHSSKDKDIVRDVAERLRADGLRVWFDEWILKPGDSIPAKIEEGLEQSRVLVLCMSAQAFGSDWAQLEAGTFRFRDPLNQERRFIPLRLDATPIKGSLAQFLYINWLPEAREQEYAKLLEACRPSESARTSPENQQADADLMRHVERLMHARLNEWRRLRSDFEAKAREYHDVKVSTFFVVKDAPLPAITFPKPNHVINLWQYFGSTESGQSIERLLSEGVTDFGLTGAKVNSVGLVAGAQTEMFCKMATRCGSLLPDEVTPIIIKEVSAKFADIFDPGKPVLVSNSNPLAKWLILMLVTTASLNPGRLKDNVLVVDPFTASLTVFDYFSFDESKVEPTSASSDSLASSDPISFPIGDGWSGIRGLLQQAYSTSIIKSILGKAGLPVSKFQYTGTYKGPFLDEADSMVSSLDEHMRDRIVVGCIQEIVSFERNKAAKYGNDSNSQTVQELQQVLARFGHDLKHFEKT